MQGLVAEEDKSYTGSGNLDLTDILALVTVDGLYSLIALKATIRLKHSTEGLPWSHR